MTKDFGQNSQLTAIEIEIIVDKAVRKTFITLGADLEDNSSVLALQKDFAFIRAQRIGGEKMADRVRATGVAAIAGGGLYALWEGIKLALRAKGVQ